MGELEDDLLMEYIKQGKELLRLQARAALIDEVFANTNILLHALRSGVNKQNLLPVKDYMNQLARSIEVVMKFDEEQTPPDATPR